jgi:16S rRNA (guanine(966)-N(2))-methyltransferase RsmD
LFDSIQDKVPGSLFLDCCAGTGAVGIEALSRGASLSVFVEQSPKCRAVIRENCSRCRFTGGFLILGGDFRKTLAGKKLDNLRFHIAFFDPPYKSRLYPDFIQVINERALMVPGGILAMEHRTREAPLTHLPDHLQLQKQLKHGDTTIDLLQWGGR